MDSIKRASQKELIQPEYWNFWQQPATNNPRWRAEATDLANRLSTLVPDLETRHVLDYGCGQGLVATCLSTKVKAIDLWDNSQKAIKQAQEVCRSCHNVKILKNLSTEKVYDLILVSSVIQYITEEQLQKSMALWKQMLKPGGLVLITDIIPTRRRIASEILALVRFAVKYGLLFNMLLTGIRELPQYWYKSRKRPLTYYDPNTIAELSAATGFKLEFVSNPNIFPTRYAVLLCLSQ